jgi:Cytochrome b5-like Heme/Steroid binding domain
VSCNAELDVFCRLNNILPHIVRKESKERTLILVSGFIHDVSSFIDKHPGGSRFLTQNTGEDMTASFFGGVYAHSNAAHNVCSTSWSLMSSESHFAFNSCFR